MKKTNQIIKNITVFGGAFATIATLSSCGNEAKLDQEGSLTEGTTSMTEAVDTEIVTTTAKTFVSTSKEGVETTIPVEVDETSIDVDYDTTIEAESLDEIPKNLISFGDNAQLEGVDINVIINAPVYSVSAESVEIENGDQIINENKLDSFNENKDSYNGNHSHEVIGSAETTTKAVTTAATTTAKVTTAATTTTKAITTTAETTTKVTTTKPVETTTKATTTTTEKTTKATTTTTEKTTKATTEKTKKTTTEDTEGPSLDDFTPAIIELTAEDILVMSKDFAKYLNDNGIFAHRNYKYDKFNMTEIYSVVYLANMDFVGPEETKRLIDGNFISDDIFVNIQNSFNFYSFYTTETVNRVKDGKNNILDLSRIIVDPEGKKAFKAHEKIITGFNTNKKSKNLKNYTDAAFYFAQGVTIKNRNGYDYSNSIYKTDREALSVGADYALCYMGDCIDEIAKDFGIAVPEYSQIMKDGRDDLSDVVRLFESYLQDEKCLTKTK